MPHAQHRGVLPRGEDPRPTSRRVPSPALKASSPEASPLARSRGSAGTTPGLEASCPKARTPARPRVVHPRGDAPRPALRRSVPRTNWLLSSGLNERP
ncbi:hypothetical protein H5410_060158 [Solanum commersonii]|uniref:Uncharacterized protein n=1 Tax=Solanum commersonii TaxID=4109 RepID=A0A9J5W568_SOLCO|nr:hypothetical protein H5410_060158 [Solanum commersonii]